MSHRCPTPSPKFINGVFVCANCTATLACKLCEAPATVQVGDVLACEKHWIEAHQQANYQRQAWPVQE